MRVRVVCGLGVTMLIFWPSSAFSSVDLPTLGRPTSAANPQRASPSPEVAMPSSPRHRSNPRSANWSSTRCAAACSARRRLEPSPRSRRPSSVDFAARDEPVLVRLAAHFLDRIGRQPPTAPLQQLLQARLRILEVARLRQLRQPAGEQALDHLARRLEPAVQVDRAEQRLERVGEDRAAPESAGLELAAAEAQLLAEPESGGGLGQRLPAHQRRPVAAQVALVGVRDTRGTRARPPRN